MFFTDGTLRGVRSLPWTIEAGDIVVCIFQENPFDVAGERGVLVCLVAMHIFAPFNER